MRTIILTLAVAVGMPTVANAAFCEAFDAATSDLKDGRCTIQEIGSDLPFRQDVTVGGSKYRIEYTSRQGRFHRWKINGKTASAYEIDRASFCGWTDDLQLSVCLTSGNKARW